MRQRPSQEQVQALRAFNRFYTSRIGLLDARALYHPLGLAEARLLFELGAGPGQSARALGQGLGMDRGQVSRTLARLERMGLLAKSLHPADRRVRRLDLTPRGQGLLADLERRSDQQAGQLLEALSPAQGARLLQAMADITALLSSRDPG
jgi:DNA-binding MarR family transcriptional regulator